jgi:hypothetical protein
VGKRETHLAERLAQMRGKTYIWARQIVGAGRLVITLVRRANISPNAPPTCLAKRLGEAGGKKVLVNVQGFIHLPSYGTGWILERV